MEKIKTKIHSRAADFLKKMQSLAMKWFKLAGRHSLNRLETVSVILEKNPNFTTSELCILDAPSVYEILKWGVVRVNRRQCLDIDYGSKAAIAGWFGSTEKVARAAVVWSHPWMGYYHWIIDVAPKLVLLQSNFGRDLGGWKLCYPRTDSAYERETLELLGIPESAVIDTRKYRAITAERVALTTLPGWYQIQPAANLLRSTLIGSTAERSNLRIYLARRGRRKCTNESEIFKILSEKGFTFIADESRSLEAQIKLFQNAEVIVAPHGAALTNILWCESGAIIIELFGENYQPPYYRNLSKFRSLAYYSICPSETDQGHWSQVDADITVDAGKLESLLGELHIF